MKDAIQRSAHLPVSIRAQQCFSDGNHRTALFTFVLSLASYSILLSPRFSLYRAYLIISARDHPDNAENTLFDLGITETSAKLLHYSRSRVKPGTADWAYLEYWAEEVRRVVVHASVVEGVYTRIQTGSRWAGGEKYFFGRKQQLVEWKGLDHQMRLEVRLAHTSFKAGS